MEETVKIGDRVKIKPEKVNPYFMLTNPTGKIIRFRNGKIRVLIDDTSSQDTEGHNCYEDFDKEDLELIS